MQTSNFSTLTKREMIYSRHLTAIALLATVLCAPAVDTAHAQTTEIPLLRTIDSAGIVGQFSSITKDDNGRLAISYLNSTTGQLKLWVDNGAGGGTAGDGIANGSELRTIDSAGIVGLFPSITTDASGRLAISYHDAGLGDLKLWVDDGAGGGTAGDAIANGTEVRTIDSAGNVGQHTSITTDANGRLAISYLNSTLSDLKLWVDDGAGGGTAGDGIANGTEVRTIDSAGDVGFFSSITTNASGHLAISYNDAGFGVVDLKLWVDDGAGGGTAGDGIANGTEVRTIDSAGDVGPYTSITTNASGRLAISYYDVTSNNLKLWVDDGAGGGTAGDGMSNGTEVRTIDSAGNVGQHTSITTDANGRLAISYYDDSNVDLKLWVDDGVGGGTAGDGITNGTEVRRIDSASDVGRNTSITTDAIGRLAISYWDSTNNDLKLAVIQKYQPRTIDSTGSVGRSTSITVDQNGRTAVSYSGVDNSNLKLWLDDGAGMGGVAGDRIANGSELRTIDSTGLVGEYTSITVDQNGRLAVSYYDRTNLDLKLWLDDGAGMGGVPGDGLANGAEVKTIDSGGDVGEFTSITVDQNGHLAISYFDGANFTLKLWLDDGAGGGTAGDGLATSGELRTIDSTSLVGQYTSITLDQNGHLAVSYSDSSVNHLKLWLDDGSGMGTAGDGMANGSEVKTIDSAGDVGTYTSITVDQNGYLAISYYDLGSFDLKLWYDNGDGGGTPGDGIANGTEAKTIDSTSDVGQDTSIAVDFGGRLAISYLDVNNGYLKLWLDDGAGGGTAGDGLATSGEFRTIDSTSFVGQFTSMTVDQIGRLAVSYHDASNSDLKLFYGLQFSPEIDVSGGFSLVSIADGDATPSTTDCTDFGNTNITNNTVNCTYTITNTGTGLLFLTGFPRVTISGAGASEFSVGQPDYSVASDGGTTEFSVAFNPSTVGLKTATVSIANSDSDENPYTFAIQGTGVDPVDTDGDGDPDSTDPDDDNDGATDIDEGTFGTDPLDPDSDDDGVSDGQELTDGTDPNDSDSYIEEGDGEYCMDWNGFLSNLVQIAEYRNARPGNLGLRIELRNIEGVVQSSVNFTLGASQQRDIVVNTMTGFAVNTYGTICAIVTSGTDDALDAQLSAYELTGTSYNFAYATPFVVPRSGAQYVMYNHYYPTQNVTELNNARYGFVQISNEETTSKSGDLVFYDQEGVEVRRTSVTVPGGARRDVDTHSVGENTAGMFAWLPNDLSADFRVVLSRYYFNIAGRLIAVAAIPAKRGIGAEIVSAFDTAGKISVVELSNTTGASVTAQVFVNTAAGVATGANPLNVTIPAMGTRHVVLNQFVANGTGNVQISSSAAGSIIAETFEYGLTAFQGLAFVANALAQKPEGSELRVSYNNFLGGCTLRLANRTGASASTALTMTRYDGTNIPISTPVNVPANGVTEVNVCANETTSAYGEVRAVPATQGTVAGDMVRSNANSSSEFRVPVRMRTGVI